MTRNKDLHPTIYKIKYERTFCLLKPDAVKRGLIGEIIRRLEKAGLKVVAMKMLVPTDETVRKHYPASDEAWVHRLGKKGLSGFEAYPDIDAKEPRIDRTVFRRCLDRHDAQHRERNLARQICVVSPSADETGLR